MIDNQSSSLRRQFMQESLEGLIEQLKRSGFLKSPAIIEAFKAIDRGDFTRDTFRNIAYEDTTLPIGEGQTISQPATVAFMLELLELKTGQNVLDVGSGSGWTTALMAQITGPRGAVSGVERIAGLVEFGRANIAKYQFKNASIVPASKALGLPQKAPFDRILVSAASQELPQGLVAQLKTGGIMVVPIQHSIFRIVKELQGIEAEEFVGFSFVPLVERSVPTGA